jgi:hypothetical protein
MSYTTVQFPALPEGEFIEVTIDAEFKNVFQEVINSGLFVISNYFHYGSKKLIPKVMVKETGQTVSILPLIGVQPNSKSKREEDECFYYTCDKFVTKRDINPLSFKEWVNWLNGKTQYWWESPKRVIHNIQLPVQQAPAKHTPVVTEQPKVIKVTPVEILMQAGLTRAEAVEHVAKHFINKQ